MAPTELAFGLPFGLSKAALQFIDSEKTFTLTDTGDLFGNVAHGYAVGDIIVLRSITTTTGISTYTKYYIISSGLTADAFKASATSGGSSVTLTTDGSAIGYRYCEARLRMANQAAGTPDVKNVNHEGDNIIIKSYNLQSLTYVLSADAFPEGLHARLFQLTPVTANLPDSYTNAYALYGTSPEQVGKSVGFWFEHAETYTDASGIQSSKTVRDWAPNCTVTPTKPADAKTSDKPSLFEYSVSVTNFAPTVDVAGVALPSGLTGAPIIRLTK